MKKYWYVVFLSGVVLSAAAAAQSLPAEFEGSWHNPRNGHSQVWRITIEDQATPTHMRGKITWIGFGGYCTTPKEGMPFSGSYDGDNLTISAPLLNPATGCGALLVTMTKQGDAHFSGTFANDWPVTGTVELRGKK